MFWYPSCHPNVFSPSHDYFPEPLNSKNQPLVVIVGPTAVGKTDLAIHLASEFDGEIINVDSRQIYRHMDIGTAKPTAEQRSRTPHHLIDILDPDQEFSLATFLDLAHAAITDIRGRHKVPIVAGGTGQYIWALLEGWQVAQVQADPELRQRLDKVAADEGPLALHYQLSLVDPESSHRIDYRNVRRVVRALEIYNTTGSTATDLRQKSSEKYPCRIIGIDTPRDDLYRRIDTRVDEMVINGLVKEVEALLSRGYSPDSPCMHSMGYREINGYLLGELSLEEAAQQIKYETHRLARHQYAWFRRKDARINWLPVGTDLECKAAALARTFLFEDHACDRMGSTTEEDGE